jgi:hypothetical protein
MHHFMAAGGVSCQTNKPMWIQHYTIVQSSGSTFYNVIMADHLNMQAAG